MTVQEIDQAINGIYADYLRDDNTSKAFYDLIGVFDSESPIIKEGSNLKKT